MRKMTTEQARNYILAGFFPVTPAESGETGHNPALTYSYLKEITELEDIFNGFPTTFCASLLADNKYCGNAQKLFSMIWDDLDITALNMIACRIVNTKADIENLHNREFQLECELADIKQEIKRTEEEYASLTAES